MKIFYVLFFILVSSPSMSHECVLQGTSVKEITIYNSCKADKSKNKSSNKDLNNMLLKKQLKKLKRENNNLKNQLLDLKIRLSNILNRINSYID
ncbi:MAG: hypothetical protein P8N41_09570 [Alphaproteobacteria bacterium]|nr:hypothetical protein [Alphaproteobacteria bacterium]